MKKHHLILNMRKEVIIMKNIITVENLSEEQQSLMATLTMAWPQLTEMQKGKLLGYVEAKAEDRREERNRATT